VRVLIFETEESGQGLNLALRAKECGHDVKYWLPPTRSRQELLSGEGLVERPKEWEYLMDGVDLVVMTGNTITGYPEYTKRLEDFFAQDYPIFGPNLASAKLELDRLHGQQVLEGAGIQILPFIIADNLYDAIDYVTLTREPIVIKPWGGEEDKSLTCVANSPEEAIFHLERARDRGAQGKLMLQRKVDGLEMGIAGWFTPEAGWLRLKEESWEHKRFMNDNLGCNTGEQGTVIRHVQDSLLFDRVLRPLTEYLQRIGYRGDCSVNCIIDSDGTPWPLEFTARLGWPDFNIRQELIDDDPVAWMKAALEGRDEFRPRQEIAVGVVMTHGDYPLDVDKHKEWAGFPLRYDPEMWPHFHWQMVKQGLEPVLTEEGLEHQQAIVTAGNYVAVATGSGAVVADAMARAYAAADSLKWPSNVMFRTDIGRKLQWELPRLQALGYAKGVEYSSDV
jgi:phosphoribosylamine---glycine ligase